MERREVCGVAAVRPSALAGGNGCPARELAAWGPHLSAPERAQRAEHRPTWPMQRLRTCSKLVGEAKYLQNNPPDCVPVEDRGGWRRAEGIGIMRCQP